MKLIEDIYSEYREVNARAIEQCERNGEVRLAEALKVCDVFKGTESVDDMIELIFSARGIEYMTKFGFPDVKTFRKFKKYDVSKHGVFIDAGEITLQDAKRCFLIGNTSATLNYAQAQGNRVYLMCGARAVINAHGYSVVKIEKDDASQVTVHVSENAKILR